MRRSGVVGLSTPRRTTLVRPPRRTAVLEQPSPSLLPPSVSGQPTHRHDLAHRGLVPTNQLGTGVADGTTYLRGDQTWDVPSGSSGVEITDGTHDVTGATKLTVTGGTVGGSTPNATLTIPAGGDTSGEIGANFDGGLSTLVPPSSADILVPFTGTLTGWKAVAQQGGSAQWDVLYWNGSGSVSFTSLVGGGTAPAIPSSDHASGAVSDWGSTAITAGGWIRITLSSVSAIRQAVLALTYSRP